MLSYYIHCLCISKHTSNETIKKYLQCLYLQCVLTVIVGSTLHSSIGRGQQSSQALTILLQNKGTLASVCLSYQYTSYYYFICKKSSVIQRQNPLRFFLSFPNTHKAFVSNTRCKCPQNKALCTIKIIYMQNN